MINFSNRDILLSSRGFKITTIKPFLCGGATKTPTIYIAIILHALVLWCQNCNGVQNVWVGWMPQTMQVLDVLQGHSASVASRYKTELLLQPTLQPLEGKNQPLLPWAMLSMLSQLQKEEKHWKESKCLFFLKSFNCKLNSELICWYI